MEKLKCLKTPELERWFCCPVLARLLVCLFGFTAFGCLCVLELLFHSRLTLAGQRVAADDGDAEALPVLLDERNLVDLVSLQVGLNQNMFQFTDQFIFSQSFLSQFMFNRNSSLIFS